MCGICGFAGLSPATDDANLLRRMNATLVHRGPDDHGVFESPQCCLAMRRLSIIDLAGGHQPISNHDQTSWIVYNGETYNYRQLRQRLESAGRRFSTSSDTEVVLQAYEQYGLSFVQHLRGMYGLAIWDSKAERLVLARDPVGIKPLFYTEHQGRLYFASEIKALLQAGVPRSLDHDSLYHYLSFLYVPAPRTMFAGIHKLKPGHLLVWERGRVSVSEFWPGPANLLAEQPHKTTVEGLWPALLESVEAHLVSDVPVGLLLSGGLDSSALAVAVGELGYKPLKTFCIGFEGAGLYDESAHARRVADFVGSDHYEHHLTSESIELLPQVLQHLDEPMADASVLPNLVVSQLAARHVKVVLSGAGGDEVLGGYRRYAADRTARWAQWLLPRLLREKLVLPLLRSLPADGASFFGDRVRLAEKFCSGLGYSPERRYVSWNSFFGEGDKLKLLKRVFFSSEPSHRLLLAYFERAAARPFEERAMFADVKTYLPADVLTLSDRMTMACSLEARVPFVDLPFMDFAAGLPLSQKVRGWQTKPGFRKALKGRLPEEILVRPKQGFGTPIDLWMRRELSGVVQDLLSPEAVAARGLLRPDFVQGLLNRHLHGGQDLSQHLWSLMLLELWHRAYIDHDYSARANLTFSNLNS